MGTASPGFRSLLNEKVLNDLGLLIQIYLYTNTELFMQKRLHHYRHPNKFILVYILCLITLPTSPPYITVKGFTMTLFYCCVFRAKD